MTQDTSFDIQETVKNAFNTVKSAPQKGKNDLVIWGGEVRADQLLPFLRRFDSILSKGMEWRMMEYTGRFEVAQVNGQDLALPQAQDVFFLERARFFGQSGDLDLRRDRDRFLWRFIGSPDLALTFSPPEDKDFWAENGNVTFREIETHLAQWRPNDERVQGDWQAYAGLGLQPEGKKHPNYVQLTQKQYWHNGKIEFVWFTGLEEAENG